jgi:hypothetical protein
MEVPYGVARADFFSVFSEVLVNGSVEVSVMGRVEVGDGASRKAQAPQHRGLHSREHPALGILDRFLVPLELGQDLG